MVYLLNFTIDIDTTINNIIFVLQLSTWNLMTSQNIFKSITEPYLKFSISWINIVQ